MAEIAAHGDAAVLASDRAIVAWINRRADRVNFNVNPTFGTLGAVFEKDGVAISALRLFSDGTMAVYFEYMLAKPVFDDLGLRQALLDRLNAVPSIHLPPDAVAKRKTIPLAPLTPEATAGFLEAMD